MYYNRYLPLKGSIKEKPSFNGLSLLGLIAIMAIRGAAQEALSQGGKLRALGASFFS